MSAADPDRYDGRRPVPRKPSGIRPEGGRGKARAPKKGKFHSKRATVAKGGNRVNGKHRDCSPRLPATSVPEDDFWCMAWLAEKRGVPLASVIRDAVFSYVMPIRPDAMAAKARRSTG